MKIKPPKSNPKKTLLFLYSNYSDNNVRLNDFLTNILGFKKDDPQQAHLANKMLEELKGKQLLELYLLPCETHKSQPHTLSSIGGTEKIVPGTIVNYYFDARLTIDGFNYVDKILKEENQEALIKTQTNLTKLSTLFVFASVAISITTLINDCTPQIVKLDDSTKEVIREVNEKPVKLNQTITSIHDSSEKNSKTDSSAAK